MSTLPTLVLVAGSWHQSNCYERITTPLQNEHNFKCIPISLPSTQGDPNADLKGDINAVRSILLSEISQGQNVVVIAHSFGGMVANSAIKNLTSHVIGLILIASGFTLSGLSFMDPLFGIPPPTWKANWSTGFAEFFTPPKQLFYHDLSDSDAEYWISQLRYQSLKAMFEGGEFAYSGWRDVKQVWYIGTIEDRGLPVLVQRMQIGMARGMGAEVVHRELRSSHSPFLSMPNEVVEIVLEAVESFTGRREEGRVVRTSKIEVPMMRLWAPNTWFRFGLPMGVGRMLGTGIVAFEWLRGLWRRCSVRK